MQIDEFVSYHASVQITHDYTDRVVKEIYEVIENFYKEQTGIFQKIVERNKKRKSHTKRDRPQAENPYREMRLFIHFNENQKKYIIETTEEIKKEIDTLNQAQESPSVHSHH